MKRRALTVGSLFTGIGGMDLGFERAGMHIVWQCEINSSCQHLLKHHFPKAVLFNDVRVLPSNPSQHVDVLIGGDPCPAHSALRGISGPIMPDLSGYFLALAGRLCPWWVVRENVFTPVTVNWFATALEALGYSVAIVRIDASSFTTQHRVRDFVVGCASQKVLDKALSNSYMCGRDAPPMFKKPTMVHCLHASGITGLFCTHIWEAKSQRLREFSVEECEALTGLPEGWTSGFSKNTRIRMCGNSVVPQVAEWIATRIVSASLSQKFIAPSQTEGTARILRRKLF